MTSKRKTGRCIICQRLGVTTWTIARANDVAIIDLCPEHAEPLQALLELGDVDAMNPTSPSRVRARHVREEDFTPLDWTPPE